MMKITDLLTEEKYENFLAILNGELNNVSRSIIHLNLPPDKLVLDRLERDLSLSEIRVEDIFELISNSPIAAAIFIAKKMEKYHPPETDENTNANIKYLPSTREMPVWHLIEYLLIKNGGALSAYLQKRRIPGAKKYEREIRAIYDEIGRTNISTESIAASIPISLSCLRELFEHLDRKSMAGYKCDHTFALTQKFLRHKKLPVEEILEWLGENGAGCDCEIIFNVCPQWEDAVGYISPDQT
ncbi:MAG: DUF2695 domain-containing protein [Gallionellaceae bacterium]|jgi:hypothetical protein|nr:DUF2695 domain-containing protein [Gallionellaceae bacterium]